MVSNDKLVPIFRALTKPEFLLCFKAPMIDVSADPDPVTDIWTYVDGLTPNSVGVGALFDVAHVYRDAAGTYDHVLISTDQNGVYLTVVVDRKAREIFGHHLLDMSFEYGLVTPH